MRLSWSRLLKLRGIELASYPMKIITIWKMINVCSPRGDSLISKDHLFEMKWTSFFLVFFLMDESQLIFSVYFR